MRFDTTVIANATEQVLSMKLVGTSNQQRYCVDYATVDRGGEHTMMVDYNDTYQEYLLLGVDCKGKNLILNSDECCDYKRITITELANGEFDVETESRDEEWMSTGDDATFPAPKPPPIETTSNLQLQLPKIGICFHLGNTISWAQTKIRKALAKISLTLWLRTR